MTICPTDCGYCSINRQTSSHYKYYKEALTYDVDPNEEWVQMMVIAYANALLHTGRETQALLFDLFNCHRKISTITVVRQSSWNIPHHLIDQSDIVGRDKGVSTVFFCDRTVNGLHWLTM